jgi:hypothetical protein
MRRAVVIPNAILRDRTLWQPSSWAGQRDSSRRFADPRIHALWRALILFRLLPNGFRRADLRNL